MINSSLTCLKIPPFSGAPADPLLSLADVLNDGNQQNVDKALAALAGPDACLDLSGIRLNANGLRAVCAVVGNPLSAIRFHTVVWGAVPDYQPIFDCLPYTSAQVFDISRLRVVTNLPGLYGTADIEFHDFGALLKVCADAGGFRVKLVVDSEGGADHLQQLKQIRSYGVTVSDVWRQTMLRDLNQHKLSNGWRWNSDIDLHFEAGEDAPILSHDGMWQLVASMNESVSGVEVQPVKNCLILGRVAAMEKFFENILARRMPKCLDLSHVRIGENVSDAGTGLTDQHANSLANLIQSELDLKGENKLSLELLRVNVSGMSPEAVLKLQAVCQRAKVQLEISRQPMAEAVPRPAVSGSDGDAHVQPVAVDVELSALFETMCLQDSAWRIVGMLEASPDSVQKLSAQARQQLQNYAKELQKTGGSLMREYGNSIAEKLKSEVSAVAAGPVDSAQGSSSSASSGTPQAAAGAHEGGGVPAVAIDHSLSSQFRNACAQGDQAMWIASQLLKAPAIVQKLEPEVVQQLRTYAQGLVGGYGILYQELGATILRQLPPQ